MIFQHLQVELRKVDPPTVADGGLVGQILGFKLSADQPTITTISINQVFLIRHSTPDKARLQLHLRAYEYE